MLQIMFFNKMIKDQTSVIFGHKKIQSQKWCVTEKFGPQKLGVT